PEIEDESPPPRRKRFFFFSEFWSFDAAENDPFAAPGAGVGPSRRSTGPGFRAPPREHRGCCATSAGDRMGRPRQRAQWPGPGQQPAYARAAQRDAYALLW